MSAGTTGSGKGWGTEAPPAIPRLTRAAEVQRADYHALCQALDHGLRLYRDALAATAEYNQDNDFARRLHCALSRIIGPAREALELARRMAR